jgi:hypothetical protein
VTPVVVADNSLRTSRSSIQPTESAVPNESDALHDFDGAEDAVGPFTEPEWSDPLHDELDRARDGAMHDIVDTIQRDQLRLVTEQPGGVLIVQGGPGTGKTAVGLHRVSWLLDNRHMAVDDILVSRAQPRLSGVLGVAARSRATTSTPWWSTAPTSPGSAIHRVGPACTRTVTARVSRNSWALA